jgi:hypothetical protein
MECELDVGGLFHPLKYFVPKISLALFLITDLQAIRISSQGHRLF